MGKSYVICVDLWAFLRRLAKNVNIPNFRIPHDSLDSQAKRVELFGIRPHFENGKSTGWKERV